MPMTPPPDGSSRPEADVEGLREGVGDQPSGQTEPNPRKTAPVVQTVVAEEQRQMEMDFEGQVRSDDPTKEEGDDQLRTAVDRLGELESNLRERL